MGGMDTISSASQPVHHHRGKHGAKPKHCSRRPLAKVHYYPVLLFDHMGTLLPSLHLPVLW
jgi:hypothetical protein